jgi:hypothetical protein
MTEETTPDTKSDKTIKQLVKLTQQLSEEDQETLQQLGFVVPTGDIEGALRGEYKLGYRCPYCNGVALYFVGNSWQGQVIELKDGHSEEVPPLHIPIEHISWTQTGRKASEINRHNPTCQECHGAVQLGWNRRLRPAFIVHIQRFVGARDKSHDRKEVLKVARASAGSDTQFSSNYNRPEEVPSQLMSDEAKAEANYIADKYQAIEAIPMPGKGK